MENADNNHIEEQRNQYWSLGYILLLKVGSLPTDPKHFHLKHKFEALR